MIGVHETDRYDAETDAYLGPHCRLVRLLHLRVSAYQRHRDDGRMEEG